MACPRPCICAMADYQYKNMLENWDFTTFTGMLVVQPDLMTFQYVIYANDHKVLVEDLAEAQDLAVEEAY